jgi:acyl transferase domain-containing protein
VSKRIAFLFPGQGSQIFGAGRQLYGTEPAFTRVIDECDGVLGDRLGVPLRDVMFDGANADLIHQTRFTQPALVALELALCAVWESRGVTASVLLGHSVGEISAAVHSGVLSLEEGLTLIAGRGQLMGSTSHGAMLAVTAASDKVTGWMGDAELDIAAINGPEATVVAGREEDIDSFATQLSGNGVRNKRLNVLHAFHSRLMEPVLGQFAAITSTLSFRKPQVPIISNLTGQPGGPDDFGPRYWLKQLRAPVRFHECAQRLAGLGIDLCLEVGPGRTLGTLVTSSGCAPGGGVLRSLRRPGDESASLAAAARSLSEFGVGTAAAAVV